jgi:hypothetical protein
LHSPFKAEDRRLFNNSHTYTVGPNGGPAEVAPKQGMIRRNPANRLLYR